MGKVATIHVRHASDLGDTASIQETEVVLALVVIIVVLLLPGDSRRCLVRYLITVVDECLLLHH